MPGARTSIFCESCGAIVPIGRDPAEAHYCADCGSYVCSSCWDGDASRCTTCASLVTGRPRGSRASLVWARKAFRDLSRVRPELEALDVHVHRRERDVRALERKLLMIRAEESTAAALRALADAPPSDQVRSLRQQVEIERLRVTGVSREPKAHSVALTLPRVGTVTSLTTATRPVRAGWKRLRTLVPISRIGALRLPHPSSRSLTAAAMVLTAAGAVVLVVVIGAAIQSTAARPPIAALGSPTPEGEVAGGNPSPGSSPSSGASAAPIIATFDELVMGEELPSEWRVLGGVDQAQVAPFPTAVDRSMRVTSAADGTATTVCRSFDASAARIAVDLFAAQPDGLSVTLRNADSGLQAGIAVGSLGTVLIQPSGEPMVGPPLERSRWQRVTLFQDAGAGMRVAVGPPGPASPSANGSSPLPGWQPGGREAEICIASPRVQAAELFIDNLVIE